MQMDRNTPPHACNDCISSKGEARNYKELVLGGLTIEAPWAPQSRRRDRDAQCCHSGFQEFPRLGSKNSQVDVKIPKLIKNEKIRYLSKA